MDSFEQHLAKATDPASGDLLGAIAFALDGNGNTLYHHTAGRQTLKEDAPALDPDSAVYLISGGKFITHLAALVLVDRGLLKLDEPIYNILPEFKDQPVLAKDEDPNGKGFKLLPQTVPMTLRHMITNSSGIANEDHPLFAAWQAATPPKEYKEGTSPIIKNFCGPLLFQPGSGWNYGHDVHFLQVVIERAMGDTKHFTKCMQELVFDPLNMKSTCYRVDGRPELRKKLLQLVERGKDDKLTPFPEDVLWGITLTISDIKSLFSDMLSSQPKTMSKERMELLFKPAFEEGSAALEAFRAEAKDFTGPTGYPLDAKSLPCNYTCAGAMVLEEDSPNLPAGSLNWMGMSNVAWAVNREKNFAMLFGPQLMPEYDDKTMVLLNEFFREGYVHWIGKKE